MARKSSGKENKRKVVSGTWKGLSAVESSKWKVERKRLKTRAKMNAVESWSVGRKFSWQFAVGSLQEER